jgi:hypothetical protein
MPKIIRMEWKVHTPNLLTEVLQNPGTSMLRVPMNILGKLLGAVADRAIQLNDPELNKLMVRLTLYAQADPESKLYNPAAVAAVIAHK